VALDIQEVQTPELEAQLVAESVAEQLLRRSSFRRAMKRALDQCMAAGAKGARIQLAGRLGGAEMSRTVKESRGSVPLQTLRAKIDYGLAEAMCPYGKIGVKAWVHRGSMDESMKSPAKKEGIHASHA
ncbi:MAG: 30S ribosomal protein S3, partial [Planctomycetota bacterium]